MAITSLNWQLVMTFLEVALVGGIFIVLFRFHKILKKLDEKKND